MDQSDQVAAVNSRAQPYPANQLKSKLALANPSHYCMARA